MRPKLKSDTFVLPVAEGVYIRNNARSFTMRGKTLAAWIERLAPALDGQHDLQEICQALPQGKHQTIEQLILTLAEQGCIKDCAHDLPHTLSPAQLATYGPAITFIDYHTDSGAARFQRFLHTPVLAIGSGEPLLAIAHALLETGNREISLLESAEAITNTSRLYEILDVLRAEQDSALRLSMADPDLWHNDQRLRQACAASGMVLYCGRGDHLASIDRLNTICRQAGVPFVPALIWEDEIQLGPLCAPDRPACWQCLWRRRRAARGLAAYATDGQVLGQAPREVRLPGKPAIGVAANLLAEAFFTHSTQVDRDILHEAYLLLEMQHLQCVRHPLFPHPLCTVCSETEPRAATREALAGDIGRLVRQPPPPAVDQRDLLEAWTDEEGGLFTRIDAAAYHQLPLTRCQVSVPLADDAPQPLVCVQACALDYPEAYQSAGRLAVAAYAESLADERRACWGTYAQYSSHAIAPARLAGWCAHGPAGLLAWTWGMQLAPGQSSLQQGEPVLVPGAAVAPRSTWNGARGEPLFQPATPATGVGADWHEALADALQRLATLFDATDEPDPLTGETRATIPAELYHHDQECSAYQRILHILDARICLLDCSDACGLPRVGAYLQGRWLGFFAHWHTLSAMRAALKQAVFCIQVRRTPGPGDERPGAHIETEAVAARRSAHLARLTPRQALMPSLAEATDYAAAADALCTVFERRARDLVVVPLPVDRTVSSSWPCALRALVLRTENEGKR